MKAIKVSSPFPSGFAAVAAALILTGCASTGEKSTDNNAARPTKFRADDGRIIDIGKSSPGDNGTYYANPHMEKGKCWVGEGFNFTGYDTLYIAPTLSTAKFNEKNPEEVKIHDIAKERLVTELAFKLNERKLFSNVVTKESDIKPGAKTLKLENTIAEFTKGGGAARWWAGVYGAGQPVLRVEGKMMEGDKKVFAFEARRSGTSAGGRVFGGYMKDEDIQIEDIRSMVLDLTDFMAALSGKMAANK